MRACWLRRSQRRVGAWLVPLLFCACVSALGSLAAIAATKPAQPGTSYYTDQQLRNADVDTLFQTILRPQPGYHQYAGLNGLIRKFQISDAATQDLILTLATQYLRGRTPETFQLRVQCCILLGDIGDERAVSTLARSLRQDPAVGVRMAAAGALGEFDSPTALSALRYAARNESSQHVRNVIGQAMRGEFRTALPSQPAPARPGAAAPRKEQEIFLRDAAQPPPLRVATPEKRLPWPFPGDFRAQHVFNNYQQPTDEYIHGGLDFIQPAGTPVSAVDSGYVVAIATNYPDWGKTHCFFIITSQKDGDEGWCYTHVDPDTYTFKVGDYIEQGQRLGAVVKFSVGDKPGVDHLHLHYVRFERTPDGKVETTSLLDPLLFFEYEDAIAPLILEPFHFVRDGTLEEFPAGGDGRPVVSGKVDIIVGLADGATDTGCNWGVPVVTFSITGPVRYALQKLALDQRGKLADARQTRPLYLSSEEKKRFIENPDGFPRYHFMRITKTDGDGIIEPADALHSWDTTARGEDGRRIWPDGQYTVTVYAWDLAGNRSAAQCAVRVENE